MFQLKVTSLPIIVESLIVMFVKKFKSEEEWQNLKRLADLGAFYEENSINNKNLTNSQKIFQSIYKNNEWGKMDGEDFFSGHGSHMK